jgi:hypothetical protein
MSCGLAGGTTELQDVVPCPAPSRQDPLASALIADERAPADPMSHDRPVAIVTGGINESWGPAKAALLEVMREVRTFAPRHNDDEYAVDVAFRSWHNSREPEFEGVVPGPVGRSQRRFIVWHSVPRGLDEASAVLAWLAGALVETADLVRTYLPTRSKAYPAETLAAEVDALRVHLQAR